MSYIVVLEDSATHGRRWTDFNTKEDFDKAYSKSLGKIVAQDISVVDALELCGATPSMTAQYLANRPEEKKTDTSNSNFHIVVENLDRHSGCAGIRYIKELSTNDTSKLNSLKKDRHIHILAENTSRRQEEILLAFTPEVCLLTAAIDDFYTQNFFGDGYSKNIDFISFVLNTIEKILENRQYWKERALIPQYPTDFPFIDIDSIELFEDIKRLFRIVEAASTNPNGTIDDLKDTFCQLCFEKAQIDYDHLMERFDNDLTPPKIL
jgi:hypothetical protein